jgi:hypothetical protein
LKESFVFVDRGLLMGAINYTLRLLTEGTGFIRKSLVLSTISKPLIEGIFMIS